jgi:hypothetical protein
MYIPNYPEDSILRRHYESTAAFKRMAREAQPPTDSVLNRHYVQLQQAISNAAKPFQSPAAKQNPTTDPQPEVRPVPAADASGGGGFFGWLMRLFS